MLNSFDSVLTIFIMIGIGYFLTHKKFFDKGTSKFFSKLVIKVSLPLMMIVNIPMRFSKEKLIASLNGIVVAFMSVGLTYIIALVLSRVLKIPKEKRAIFIAMFTFSNSIFIGLPVNISLFGEGSAPYVFIYFIANTSLFWTLGSNGIRKSSEHKNQKLTGLEYIKKIISPPFMGFLIGMTVVLLEIKLPPFIMSSFKYIGGLTTPLSLFFIGIVIYYIDFKKIKLDLCSYTILAGRFIISPAIMYACASLFNLPELLNKVLLVEASLPIMTQCAIVSEYYETNADYAALMVGFSTIIGMLLIPIYSFLL